MSNSERRAFFESVRRLIHWFSRRLAMMGIDPDDLAAEAVMLVWRDAHTFDPHRGSAASWVRIIVIRAALGLARKGRREKAGQFPLNTDGEPVEVADDKTTDPSARVVMGDSVARVHAAVTRLPARERQLIGLRYGLVGGDCLTLADVGRAIGVSGSRAGTVERRALQQLRELLG